MNNTRKAILLSALVLPGLGQITLKRYKAGFAIITVTMFSIVQLMNIAMQQADLVVNRLMTQGGTMDIASINNAASQSASGNTMYNFYFWLIVSCWLISLIDIRLAGRKTS